MSLIRAREHYNGLDREQARLASQLAQSDYDNERLRDANEDIRNVRQSSPFRRQF